MLTKTFNLNQRNTPFMNKHNIFAFLDRGYVTQMLRTGANQSIHQSVQAELEVLLVAIAH